MRRRVREGRTVELPTSYRTIRLENGGIAPSKRHPLIGGSGLHVVTWNATSAANYLLLPSKENDKPWFLCQCFTVRLILKKI